MKKYARQLMILFLFGLFLFGKSTVANAAVSSDEEGYLWRTDLQGNVEIYGVTSLRTATEISVPAQIDGKNVVKIACDTFTECRKLKTISLPSTVTRIDIEVFDGCISLETINANGNEDEIWQTIAEGSSWSTEGQKEEIGKGAFYGCNLSEIRIPASVCYIAPRAFGANYGLKKITVSENNREYCSVKGVLYTKKLTMLCQVPANYKVTTFVLPDEVTMIEEYAFGNNRHIVEIYRAAGIPEYREKAFWNMANYMGAE